MARNDPRVLHDTHFQVTQWTRGIPRADSASSVPARAAPHTRAFACTRACTLYGCAARAPHGNDESSTLEHLSPLVRSVTHSLSVWCTLASSRFLADSPRVALSHLRRATAESRVPDHRPLCFPCTTPVCMWTCIVRIRNARSCACERRPRSCHDFAFVYARSLSFGRDHLRHLRALVRSPALRSRSLAAVRCWQICVAAGICFRFQWFMPVNGSRARESVMLGRYRWQLSMGRSSVLLARMRSPGELEFKVSF